MCPVESVRQATCSSRRTSNGRVSLKMIEKRLRHLRQQLQNLTKLQMPHTTSNLLAEHDSDDYDEHQRQYKQRLHQLLRLYDKQV